MDSRPRNDNPLSGNGASPGKIFIGGLAKDASYIAFNKHFGQYGEITDSVIMKDKHTGQPRGFGFITYADPSVVDKVIEDTHIINGKQVEIKRTIPKGSSLSKDIKTKKIFVGGIPSSLSDDDFKECFSKYGTVVEHQLMRDRETNRPRGFGFIIFDSEEVVDDLLSKGNKIDIAGSQVEIKKAEPKKSSNPTHGNKTRDRPYVDHIGGLDSPYAGFDGGFAPGPFNVPGPMGGRLGAGYNYASAREFGGGYGGYGRLGGYRGDPSLGYPSRFGPLGGGGYGEGYEGGRLGGFGRGTEGYGGGYGGSGMRDFGRGTEGYGGGYEGIGGFGMGAESYGGYGGPRFGSGYESGPGGSYGGTGEFHGRGGHSGNSRYHPYAR